MPIGDRGRARRGGGVSPALRERGAPYRERTSLGSKHTKLPGHEHARRPGGPHELLVELASIAPLRAVAPGRGKPIEKRRFETRLGTSDPLRKVDGAPRVLKNLPSLET